MAAEKNHRAVVLTALPVEYEAVRASLKDVRDVEHPRGTLYEVGTVGSFEVAICMTGPGNPMAALEAERAIEHFDPRILLFVGVAGGLKDVNLGDVVASTKVYGYTSGKAAEEFLPRPALGESAYRLVQRAHAVAREEQWSRSPRAFVAPIAAGEAVISDSRSTLFAFLRHSYSDALAVEMEGFGALRAVYANHPVEGMVIRGISDRIDGKVEADKAGWQKIAAENAARFAFGLLKHLSNKAAEIENPPLRTVKIGGPEVVLLAADADERLLARLVAHFSILEYEGLITLWHRGRVQVGRRLQDELEAHVGSAKIILILLSPDFFQQHQTELELALQQQQRGAVVVPVNLRPMAAIGQTFRGMIALPRDGRAVTMWKNTDDSFREITDEVHKLLKTVC